LRADLPRLYGRARRLAVAEMVDYGEHAAAAALPAECPYSFDEIVAEDWFPPSRAGA
jgi:hypothetical protein